MLLLYNVDWNVAFICGLARCFYIMWIGTLYIYIMLTDMLLLYNVDWHVAFI